MYTCYTFINDIYKNGYKSIDCNGFRGKLCKCLFIVGWESVVYSYIVSYVVIGVRDLLIYNCVNEFYRYGVGWRELDVREYIRNDFIYLNCKSWLD